MVGLRNLGRDQSVLVASGTALFVLLIVFVLQPWRTYNGFMTIAPIGRDFVNFWLGGKLSLDGNLALLADWDGYTYHIAQTFYVDPEKWFIFSYPPHILPMLVPFGALPPWPSVVLWTALDIALMVAALRLVTKERGLTTLMLTSPAVLVMLAYGQPIGLFAFLATYVLVRGHERPLVAGVCLGLLTIKPQFAAILGVFLVCTGYWRAVLWSVPVTLALIGISLVAFGVQPWINFFTVTLPLQNYFIFSFFYDALLATLSVYCGVRMFGLPGWTAGIAQAIFSISVFVMALAIFRRRGPDARGLTAVLIAVPTVLPYYNSYDLALCAHALTVVVFSPGEQHKQPFLPLGLMVPFWLAPIYTLPFGIFAIPVSHVVLAVTVPYALYREVMASGAFSWFKMFPPRAASGDIRRNYLPSANS